MQPQIIVIEGLDGTGKTTIAKKLAESLGAVYLRTPLQELLPIRNQIDAALSEAKANVLFYAANVHEVSQRIQEYIQKGRSVIIDRYWLTTQVYGEHANVELPYEQLSSMLLLPDFTIFLDASDDTRSQRMHKRGILHAHDQMTLHHEHARKIRFRYQEKSNEAISGRFLSISAEEKPEQIIQNILSSIQEEA